MIMIAMITTTMLIMMAMIKIMEVKLMIIMKRTSTITLRRSSGFRQLSFFSFLASLFASSSVCLFYITFSPRKEKWWLLLCTRINIMCQNGTKYIGHGRHWSMFVQCFQFNALSWAGIKSLIRIIVTSVT